MSQSELPNPNPQFAIAEIFTIGHSTRPAESFIELLKNYSILNLVDVRSFPGSRKYPQYNQGNLSSRLSGEGIRYHHLKSLGGFQKPAKTSSVNHGWKNEGFRGYADHMETAEFHDGLEELLRIASTGPTDDHVRRSDSLALSPPAYCRCVGRIGERPCDTHSWARQD